MYCICVCVCVWNGMQLQHSKIHIQNIHYYIHIIHIIHIISITATVAFAFNSIYYFLSFFLFVCSYSFLFFSSSFIVHFVFCCCCILYFKLRSAFLIHFKFSIFGGCHQNGLCWCSPFCIRMVKAECMKNRGWQNHTFCGKKQIRNDKKKE